MRVADYIAQSLFEHNIRHVFMLTGGAAMHLNDALGNHSGLDYICCHHEQACSMAAESYYRLSNKLAVVNVTAGPGGINALNGVFGAYVDSIGMIVISGQAKRETMSSNYDIPLRQLGDQELDIVSVVRSMTKYATVLQKPEKVKEVMQKAIFLAKHGRPGPVWIDVPIDIQAALIDPNKLISFDPNDFGLLLDDNDLSKNTIDELEKSLSTNLDSAIIKILEQLSFSKRPVIFAGSGVRMSGSYDIFMEVIRKMGIPIVTGWNAHDLIHNEHPQYAGRPGTVGDRAGNFSVQNADFLLVLGSRLNIRQVSYNWESFARHSWIAQVDIDPAELSKPTLKIDHPIHADLSSFLEKLTTKLNGYKIPKMHNDYLKWCRKSVKNYPVVLSEYWKSEKVNPYCFMDQLFSLLDPDDVIVTGDGTACVTSFQAAKIKKGQRLYTNSGCASMGYDLPGAIGACVASNGKRVICIAGDGSIMLNIQELQTIIGYSMPIKIFVLNNSGYHSIRQTQNNHFSANPEVGVGPDSGLTFPNFKKLAKAFGYKFESIKSTSETETVLKRSLNSDGPLLCEVLLDLKQEFSPKLASKKLPDGSMISSSLENMSPFLSEKELEKNILVNSED